jgi:hypothetical protein
MVLPVFDNRGSFMLQLIHPPQISKRLPKGQR